MKGLLKFIAVVATCVVGVVAIGTIIDILYKKSISYFSVDENDC